MAGVEVEDAWRLRPWAGWLLGPTLLLGGCLVGSINPLFEPSDAEPHPELIGTWQEADSASEWRFAQGEGASYTLSYNEGEGEAQRFDAILAPIGDQLFIQLSPQDKLGAGLLLGAHMVPLYSFGQVTLEDESLTLAFLSVGWAQENLSPKDYFVPEIGQQAGLVTFLSQKELRRWVEGISENESAFELRIRLRRAQ